MQTSQTSSLNDVFRSALRGKTRIALAWIFSAALIFAAREYPHPIGILICFAGAKLRFWASGYLRKDTRPAVGGPYAYVRNPLYLGTYLMAVGTAAAIQNWPLLAVVSVAFAVVYHFIILDEEEKLKQIFGEPYLKYCSAVPRFFARPWPASASVLDQVNPEPAHRKYDWDIAMKNKAYEAYASFFGLMGFVTLVAYLWKRFSVG